METSRESETDDNQALAGGQVPGDAPELPPQLGQYKLGDRLGGDSLGQVFRAQHVPNGTTHVVKVLTACRFDGPTLDRFRQAVKSIGTLSHPNLVAVQHADGFDGIPFLARVYVRGRSLSDISQEHVDSGQPISVESACELIRQAAVGLHHAHEEGVVHQGVNPDTLMLDHSGVVKILDLGLAQATAIDPSESDGEEASAGSGPHRVFGKMGYKAPEQFRQAMPVDARADVYALGATLYLVLAGQSPFPNREACTSTEDAISRLDDPVPDIREIRSDIPRELSELISQALATSPEDRPESAQALAARLRLWSTQGSLSQLGAEVPEVARRFTEDTDTPELVFTAKPSFEDTRWGSSWLVLTLVLLLGFGLLAGTLYHYSRPDIGTLIVEGEIEDAKISLRAARGLTSEIFELSPGAQSEFELPVGTWRFSVEGIDSRNFSLDERSATVGKDDRIVLSLKRSPQSKAFQTQPVGPPDQGALPWLLDTGAVVFVGETELEVDASEGFPSVDAVTAITMDGLSEVSDQMLAMLNRFSGLRELTIRRVALSRLPDLSNLEALETLDLSDTELTQLAGKLPRGLKHLNLSGTGVGSAVGRRLWNLDQLESLDLSATEIDASTLLDLASLKSLKRLVIHDVDVSEEDINAIQEELPDCEIEVSAGQ